LSPLAAVAAVLRGDPPAAAIDVALSDAAAAEAGRHGVAPLLADRLRTAGRLGPDHALARAERGAAASAVVRERELGRALAELHARQVPCLVFKGAQLAHAVYARSELRPRLDSDLLVREQDRAAAHEALVACGYERVPQFTGDLVAYQAPYVLRRQGTAVDIVDLHWRLANPQPFGAVLAIDELFAEAVPLPALGPAARGLGDVHALLVACVHPVAHHRREALLIWTHDVHLLAGRLDRERWTRFAQLALDRGVGLVCAHSLGGAAETLATRVPDDVMTHLRRAPVTETTARYLAPDRRHIQTIWADLQTLSSWRDRWRLVQQHAFPPREYMRRVYAPASDQPLMLLYARRMLRGARKWLVRA
jgi:hypothetical protein